MKKVFYVIVSAICSVTGFAQNNVITPESGGVIQCESFGISRPLREIAAENPIDDSVYDERRKKFAEKGYHTRRTPQTFVYSAEKDGPAYGNESSLIQKTYAMGKLNPDENPSLKLNQQGQNATGFRPMDPSGAAGGLYYVQAINGTTMRVYNKSTGATVFTSLIGNLWSPATPNDGDPIIMYDRFADRWFVSQFGTSGNRIYIAISTTNDPTGSYYTYTFTSPQFPDYLKFGIWQDGYYMTSNQGTQKIFAFQRSAMLTGSPTAKVVYQTFSPLTGGGFFCPMPGDADGAGGLPAAGTPCPIFQYTDNAWGGGAIDGIRIYNCTVNWVPATPTMTITLNSTLATSAFDASYNASWNDIPQPGTSQMLDGIGGILQYRTQITTWSTYRSAVMCWPVRISASQRSIMWAELRQNISTGVWSVYQQSIYAPDATKYRWMGSIAMDDNGSIGLCYARSSSTTGDFMSLYYTGRTASDPLNTMTLGENLAIAGTGSQTGGVNRCGDYAQTTIDSDGTTFWHTGEYMGGTTGGSAARTRIYSFQIPVSGPTAGVAIASNDADNVICAGTSVTFTATPTNGGTSPSYQWQVNGSNVGTDSPTYTTSGLTNGQTITCIMTSNLPGVLGNPATSNTITITVNNPPTTSAAGTDQTICASTATLAGNTATTGTGTWTFVSGPATPSITTPSSPTSGVTGMTASGTYVFQWTISNAPCTASSDQVSITRNANPTTANAGTDQTVCASTATLAGNNPTVGTGLWTFVSGPATPTITTPTANNSGITGMSVAGTYVFQWTISNAPCTASSDQVSITRNAAPTTSNAGPDASVCGLTTTLAGNTPTVGTGTWTQTAGPGTSTFSNPNSPTSSVTVTVAGAYTYRWSITNPPCTASNNTVVITFNNLPTTANAGTDQTVCASTATLAGNNPTSGTGTWTFISGPATPTITTPTANNSGITGMTAAGTYIFQWSITNAPCTASTDQVSITRNAAPTTSNAGPDATVCGLTTTLAGNTPVVGTGTWTQTAGPGTSTFSNASSPTSTVTVTVAGAYTYRWSITNPPCTASNNSVVITFDATPTTANAGSDQSTCITPGSATLAGNTITSGTGTWTFVSGPATPTITTPSSPTSGVTGMTTAGTYIFQWTSTSGSCPSSSDQVSIVVSSSITPTAVISVTSGTNPSCTGQSVTFTAAITNGGVSPVYQWQVNGSNVGTNSPTFTSSSLTTGDVVTCILTSSEACASPISVTSNSINMTVDATPATPTVSQSGADLVSSSSTGNQWYLDGVAIPGATGQTYTPTADGVYTVIVTVGSCSSTSSSGINIIMGVNELNNPFGLTIYPNPSNGIFNIKFNTEGNKEYTLRILNSIGQIVYTENIAGNGGTIDKVIKLKDIQTGMYSLTLMSGTSETIKKVIIH